MVLETLGLLLPGHKGMLTVGILVTPSSAIRLIYATRLMDWANIGTLLWCTRTIRGSVGIAREYSPHGHLSSFSHPTSPIYYLTTCVRSQTRSAIVCNPLSGKSIFVCSYPHVRSTTCRVPTGEYTIAIVCNPLSEFLQLYSKSNVVC